MRPDPAGGAEPFGYARRLGPPMGVLLGLALVEAAVVHLVAMAWAGWPVALALGALDLALVALLAGFLWSFRRRPVTLSADRLVLRAGWKEVAVPVSAIAGFRDRWTAADLKAPDAANLALVAWPNTVLDLAEPVLRRGRPVRLVAHCLDDPAAFRARLEAVLAGRPSPGPTGPSGWTAGVGIADLDARLVRPERLEAAPQRAEGIRCDE